MPDLIVIFYVILCVVLFLVLFFCNVCIIYLRGPARDRPFFAYFLLFLFYTQNEAVCVETCVKISDKSEKNEEVIAYAS